MSVGQRRVVCCVDADAPEADGPIAVDPCPWALVGQALRKQLAELPAAERTDLEAFVELVEGIAALDALKKG